MNLSKLLRREIENQIEDRVVPVIKSIIGPPISISNSNEQSSKLETYEISDEGSSPHFNENRVPFIQDENGFI